MKNLNQFIKESLLDDEDDLINDKHIFKPKNYDELIRAIKHCLDSGTYDLNCIDTSKITSMSGLFSNDRGLFSSYGRMISQIDISEWDVSNVENMS